MTTLLYFNASWYLSQNPDVAAAIEAGAPFNAFEHFTLYGRAENRSASPVFDAQEYLNSNPDVAEAVAQGLITAWDHFELFGGAEGRSPTPLFNEAFYLQQNPDVAAAIEQGIISSAAQHFALFGQNEPRAINPAINLGQYINANPDIGQAAANGLINVFDHLLQYGVNEGRDLGNGVSLGDFSNDPGFTQALGGGNPVQALIRVESVAPFIPTFERPAGWTPPANTPIPVDFVPPADSGIKLVIPPEVVVPDDVELPEDVFDPVEPVTPPAPTPGGGGGGGDTNPTFTVTETAGVLTFGGTATGNITVTTDGDNVATFSRGGVTATTMPDLDTLTKIIVGTGQTLALSAAQASNRTIDGAGSVAITGSAGDQTIAAASTGGNLIRGGEGEDTVTGGAGDDVLVLVGTTADNQYKGADIPAGLAGVLTLSDLNSRTVSEAVAGESYDGGGGVNTLHVYGTVDMTGISLAGITHVVVHSDVTFAPGQLDGITHITGDGGSTVRLAAGSASTMDLSGITLANIGQLDVGDNVTAQMNQANLSAIATVSSYQDAKIQAAVDTVLDFSGKNVFGSAEVLKSNGTQQAATLKTSGGTNIGAIIDTVNGIIATVNGTLTTYSLGAYTQALAVEDEYALMCDVLAGMTGASVIQGRSGVQNFISGGDGSDTLIGGNLTNFIYVGQEDTNGSISNIVTGGTARDFIAGGVNADTIHGGNGDDFIYGGDGIDLIHGDEGNDFIRPGEGADNVSIASGSDFIDLTETAPATDTLSFQARIGTPSYVLAFDTTSVQKDALSFNRDVFIQGSLGTQTVIGTGSSSEKFDLNTADFNGLVRITDTADANFSDAGTKIAAAVTNTAADDAFIFAISNGTNTLVLGWDDRAASGGNGDGAMDAGEFTQIVILVGVGSVTGLDMNALAN